MLGRRPEKIACLLGRSTEKNFMGVTKSLVDIAMDKGKIWDSQKTKISHHGSKKPHECAMQIDLKCVTLKCVTCLQAKSSLHV